MFEPLEENKELPENWQDGSKRWEELLAEED